MKPASPPPPIWKKWLQFSLLQLLVCAIISSLFLYFGIQLGGHVHKQRADEQIRKISLEKDAAILRNKHEMLQDEMLGYGSVQRAVQRGYDAVTGNSAETDAVVLRRIFSSGSDPVLFDAPAGLPSMSAAYAWLATFRRIPHAANKDKIEFLEGCLGKRKTWTSPEQAWSFYRGDRLGNLLPLYWYACDDPALTDTVIAKVGDDSQVANASGFLSWFFTYMSNAQRERFMHALLQFNFNLKDMKSVSRAGSTTLATISTPKDACTSNRNFCLGIECSMKVYIDDQLAATISGVDMGIGTRKTLSTAVPLTAHKVFEGHKPGPHKCRLVFNGVILGAEWLGTQPVPEWHKVPIERDSEEFVLTLK